METYVIEDVLELDEQHVLTVITDPFALVIEQCVRHYDHRSSRSPEWTFSDREYQLDTFLTVPLLEAARKQLLNSFLDDGARSLRLGQIVKRLEDD